MQRSRRTGRLVDVALLLCRHAECSSCLLCDVAKNNVNEYRSLTTTVGELGQAIIHSLSITTQHATVFT